MNRRAFLLGCISTPIAGKVDAVSAAPRPEWIESVRHVATIETNEIIAWKLYIDRVSAICDSGELKNIIWSPTACRLTAPASRAMLGLLAAIRLAESAARIRLKPMTRINLPGGYIEIIAFFRDHKGKRSTMYRAVSAHTHEAIECFSMSKAQFFIRSTHEEYTVLMHGV